MTNELSKPTRRDIKALLTGPEFSEAVRLALPSHLKPERFIQIAITALTRTPKLLDCTQESFFKCLLDLSALGIEPDGRRAHLIPYGTTCTLIIDYKGLAELAMRSGVVSVLHADVVCENDDFEYDRGELKKHKIDFRKPRGEMFAAYAIVKFKDGTEKCDVMDRPAIDAIRKRSRASGSGPWVTDYNEMAKKTVFRRLSKWLPLSAEFRDALEKDDGFDALPVATAPKFVPPMIGTGNGLENALMGAGESGKKEKETDSDHLPMGDDARSRVAALMERDGIDADGLLFFLRRSDDGDFKSWEEIPEKNLAGLEKSWDTVKGMMK